MRILKINFTAMTKPVRKILENRMYEKENEYNNCSYYKNINDPELEHFNVFRPIRTRMDYINDLNTIENSKNIDITFDNERGFLVHEKYKYRMGEFPVELVDGDFKEGIGNFYTLPNIANLARELENK